MADHEISLTAVNLGLPEIHRLHDIAEKTWFLGQVLDLLNKVNKSIQRSRIRQHWPELFEVQYEDFVVLQFRLQPNGMWTMATSAAMSYLLTASLLSS